MTQTQAPIHPPARFVLHNRLPQFRLAALHRGFDLKDSFAAKYPAIQAAAVLAIDDNQWLHDAPGLTLVFG